MDKLLSKLHEAEQVGTFSVRRVSSVVAVPGAHSKLMIGRRLRLHLDKAVSVVLIRVRRFIPDGVSATNVVAYSTADFIQFVQRFRKKRGPAGAVGHAREDGAVLGFQAAA